MTLAGDRNKDVTYHGLLSVDKEVKNDYARDLLNRNAHYELGKDQTFTTHMILADDITTARTKGQIITARQK